MPATMADDAKTLPEAPVPLQLTEDDDRRLAYAYAQLRSIVPCVEREERRGPSDHPVDSRSIGMRQANTSSRSA